MTNSLLIVVGIFIAVALGLHSAPAFAMHDSTLDVNTWSASDNSTQRHTIDLNQGAPSPSAAAGASTTPEEITDESTEESSTDGNGDETTGTDGNGGEDGNGDDGNSGED
ncbi:MAG: hypothetical protein ACR2IS_15800 [Nitrososphaeraceae archaeon]